jgi:hypothetical protein
VENNRKTNLQIHTIQWDQFLHAIARSVTEVAFFNLKAVLWIRDVYPWSWNLILIYPGFRISDLGSRISDPTTTIKEEKRGRGEFVILTFFVATNFNKFKIILFVNRYSKI